MCLLTLIVVVIAGAKLAGKFADAQIDISADAPAAAQTVAKAADAKADEISSASQ
jgi:hypothetical protein